MGKKDFTSGLNSLLGDKETKSKGNTKKSQEEVKQSETRATFIINEDILEKVKAIAYWDRLLIKEVVNTALQEAIDKYTKKNGEIKPIK